MFVRCVKRPAGRTWPGTQLLVQVAAANLRFGDGATREVGMDFKNMNAKKVHDFPTLVEDVDRR
jgi:hypothetical protein